MQEQLISFETAKLAKEKEFDLPCLYFYPEWESDVLSVYDMGEGLFTNDMKQTDYDGDRSHGFGDITLVPTQSLLQKWLRDKHDIFVELEGLISDREIVYAIDIWYIKENHYYVKPFKTRYDSYESALESALQEALKLIKE